MDLEEAKAKELWHYSEKKIWQPCAICEYRRLEQKNSVGELMYPVPERSTYSKLFLNPALARGFRRIEAVTGDAARAYYQKEEDRLAELSGILKVKNDDLVTKVKALLSELKDKEKEIEAYKQAAAEAGAKKCFGTD